MKTLSLLLLALTILLSTLLAACSSPSTNGAGSAAEKYFQAIVDGDEDRIATISCADWESGARADVAAFVGVEARLENVSCQPVSETEGEAIVECSGAIVATYNNEDTSFDLKGKQLKAVNQSGEWLICGYAQ